MKILQNKIPPPVISLIIILLMWEFHTTLPIVIIKFSFSIYIGIACIFIGLCMDILSFFRFLKNKTTINPIIPENASSLVIDGFYRFTRNPMYLGMLFVLTGIAILFSSLSSFLLLPVYILLINTLQIKPEEEALEKVFSEQYLNYKNNVRRWL
ncbi:MAG: isoprenylcysteine carboxylmethyltransferase family protein [Gammaproteobacteria bacterium]|nr:isoprenylcysteine carboxylmethyltransferase family protein [Gammaproteobacteria bacterium]